MGYGRPRKYTDSYMNEFVAEFYLSGLSLKAFCAHRKVPYVSLKLAHKRWLKEREALVVDKILVEA